MATLQAVHYRAPDGSEPVNDFIDRLSVKRQVAQQRLAQFEELARLVIKHRAALGISQKELADRVGTSHSAISRLESGRHKTSVETLQRVAECPWPCQSPHLWPRRSPHPSVN